MNRKPMNRVLFSPLRDANPFFHLMESLWMLAGRNDATWLDQFVGDFSKRFAETDGFGTVYLHGAYGFRWRKHFDVEGGGEEPDQLEKAISLLKANPEDRQVVIAMWDPVADLGAIVKDKPCNTHIYLRIRTEHQHQEKLLDLTVCCRSNDAVWGAHGANAVHFSVLQEYLAARIGVSIGTFYQFSNNYHVYRPIWSKLWPAIERDVLGSQSWYTTGYPSPIVTAPDLFDCDLLTFFGANWEGALYHNKFFAYVAVPLRRSYALWRAGEFERARVVVHGVPVCDWTVAAQEWYARRVHKQAAAR
jgi:hypothetical protein